MILIGTLLPITCLLLLTACHKSINAGTVIDKQFIAAHRTYSPIVMTAKKSVRIIPRWINHPDHFSICVQDDENFEWWDVT